MTRNEETRNILNNAINTLLARGYQIARPERNEGDTTPSPLTWFYVADKDGNNFLYIGFDDHFGEWSVSKPYVPSKDNGTQARLNNDYESSLNMESIDRWLREITTIQALIKENGFRFNLKTMRFYKDFSDFKERNLNKSTHCRYIYLTPEEKK